ncbi:unnamed protein product [Cuscuta epithymum]|uniref:RBR-type E3 ubiquitin transferase n=1 Tax=Cuscuta epithymum TaxID=186058 RepID=A0AAV0DPS4_9ASTE|nr:unnamed protein product [Cuscuta epithymum]
MAYSKFDDNLEFDDDIGADSSGKIDYSLLKEEEIWLLQEDDVNEISSALYLPRGEARVLLLMHDWSVSRVLENWFSDEERVRKAAGLLPVDQISQIRFPENDEFRCKICFDDYPLGLKTVASCGCGHVFCVGCFESWIHSLIRDGPGSLFRLRCPEVDCNAAVPEEIFESVARDEDKIKYRRFLLRSYVEQNQIIKWCPGPGCDYAVKFDTWNTENCGVECECTTAFCWKCTEDSHHPVDCDTVRRWMVKATSESENLNWILANSKPCPRCKRAIEKNNGCMHMTCIAPCHYQFCWICLKSWENHGCNRWERAEGTALTDDEKMQEKAKLTWKKYMHFFARWEANDRSRKTAVADLCKVRQDSAAPYACSSQLQNTSLRQIVEEAWEQIVECRRMLKWMYAYGYYLPEDENEAARRQLFEYSQGEAESMLERLHRCAETELAEIREEEEKENGGSVEAFRRKLVNLTRITKHFFDKLGAELENNPLSHEDPLPSKKGGKPSSANKIRFSKTKKKRLP